MAATGWKKAAASLSSWCLLGVVYLLFATTLDATEAAAGGSAGILVLLLLRPLKKYFLKPLRVKPAWLPLLLMIPPAMVQESWLLALALFRRLGQKDVGGRFIRHPYPGREDERHDPAHHVFMAFGVCITPNSYLVHFDRQKNDVVVRQLVGEALSAVDRKFVELP